MKRVLFITHFWPPSGKASLHWPLDILRHLPKDEIEPIILTVEEETFTQKDESLLKKLILIGLSLNQKHLNHLTSTESLSVKNRRRSS